MLSILTQCPLALRDWERPLADLLLYVSLREDSLMICKYVACDLVLPRRINTATGCTCHDTGQSWVGRGVPEPTCRMHLRSAPYFGPNLRFRHSPHTLQTGERRSGERGCGAQHRDRMGHNNCPT